MKNISKFIHIFIFILIGLNKSYGDELARKNETEMEMFKNDMKEMRQVVFEEECKIQCETSENKDVCTVECINEKFKEIDKQKTDKHILSSGVKLKK